MRFLLIKRHLSKVILLLRSADAENPAKPAAGGTYKSCVGMTECRIDPVEVSGTGDDSHECGMY